MADCDPVAAQPHQAPLSSRCSRQEHCGGCHASSGSSSDPGVNPGLPHRRLHRLSRQEAHLSLITPKRPVSRSSVTLWLGPQHGNLGGHSLESVQGVSEGSGTRVPTAPHPGLKGLWHLEELRGHPWGLAPPARAPPQLRGPAWGVHRGPPSSAQVGLAGCPGLGSGDPSPEGLPTGSRPLPGKFSGQKSAESGGSCRGSSARKH